MKLLTLIGYRGTGKSTVAKIVAERLGWEWVDADIELAKQAGRSIAAIFAADGESAFRDLETEVIERLVEKQNCVIAAGGGVVLREQNRKAIKKGRVAWLTAEPDAIAKRINADPNSDKQRPNLTKQGGIAEIVEVLAKRGPLYEAAADATFATDAKTPTQVAEEVAAWMQPD